MGVEHNPRDIFAPRNWIWQNLGFGMNQQSFDLGQIHDKLSGMEAQKNFIAQIDKDFDLVMITERMEESLVLLADLLCVPLETVIIVKNINVRPQVEVKKLSQANQEKLEQYLEPDRLLYDHFLKKLEQKIK